MEIESTRTTTVSTPSGRTVITVTADEFGATNVRVARDGFVANVFDLGNEGGQRVAVLERRDAEAKEEAARAEAAAKATAEAKAAADLDEAAAPPKGIKKNRSA